MSDPKPRPACGCPQPEPSPNAVKMPGTVHRPDCPEVAELIRRHPDEIDVQASGGIIMTPGEADARRALDEVAGLRARVEELERENAALSERIVTVDIDGRTIRFDKLAECEAALDAAEQRIDYLEARGE